MTLQTYLDTVNKRFTSGMSREHAYRGDLEALLRALAPEIEVTNEPANVTDCGNPDYVITRNQIPIGYIEAKDVGKDLSSKAYREQFTRYRQALDNLIITDYLHFQFFQHGDLVHEVRLGEIVAGKLTPLPENFADFEALIHNFCTFVSQTITTPRKLAEMMAAKARLLQITLTHALTADESVAPDAAATALQEQYQTFRRILIHDLSPAAFADLYAQTLAYGMFAARLHDTCLDTFSREDAAKLVPHSNPFLRNLFQHIAGYNIDPRIRATVDNLADVFRATDVEALLTNFGSTTQRKDPVIHFYETFLAEYDPALRKARGVWYTPEPVVSFIVRAVDDLLKSEFDLPLGLADTRKTTVRVPTQTPDKRTASGFKEVEREVHTVQILDPATGTGTFLAEIIKHIYRAQFEQMRGAWPGYVEHDLIPRLNGFELLMASYAMAHLKLDMLLRETGYTASLGQRLHIYLTNSLEEYHPDAATLFASWLSAEANAANRLKRDTPVMVVLGNPPYSTESVNKGDWIMHLMEDYKREPNGHQKLQERNPKAVNDDYVKFLRYGQYLIEKNGEGILAFINPHGFLDNPTFRGMRWQMLTAYDHIYILDLHGNARKQELSPDGSPDENVFDIQQGVSINILVKTGRKASGALAEVQHCDVYGSREHKHQFLYEHSLDTASYQQLTPRPPYHFFVPKDYGGQQTYREGFSVTELFPIHSAGIVTSRDALTVQFTQAALRALIHEFAALEVEAARYKYQLGADVRGWKVAWAQQDLRDSELAEANIRQIAYRPFDARWTYYTGNSSGFHGRPRGEVMQHLLVGDNVGLVFKRGFPDIDAAPVFITNTLIDYRSWSRPGMQGGDYLAPLYLSPETNGQGNFLGTARKPNLNMDIVQEIARGLGLTFQPHPPASSPNLGEGEFTPLDLLDYIYAVLHSPTYRETYAEFLKIDFPRVPYPDDANTFWELVALGGELRRIHLLESPRVDAFITEYLIAGDNAITRRLTQSSPGFELTDGARGIGRVWINDAQYFNGVPLAAWEFPIGGYQPAQKWLKDRRGRKLSFDEISHYQKIIVALMETERIMAEIDAAIPAWPVV